MTREIEGGTRIENYVRLIGTFAWLAGSWPLVKRVKTMSG
jgi:hypothetical protein